MDFGVRLFSPVINGTGTLECQGEFNGDIGVIGIAGRLDLRSQYRAWRAEDFIYDPRSSGYYTLATGQGVDLSIWAGWSLTSVHMYFH